MSSKKTLLITGWTWYIGSHAVVAFEQAGYQTVIVDNLVNSSTDSLKWIEKILWYIPTFYECDIRDGTTLTWIFQKHNFDAVIHFAGLKAVGESCENIHTYQENNVSGSIALFSVMEKFHVKKIIFSSSATVYSTGNIPPFTEDMSVSTTNPYWTSKLVIEELLKDYALHAWWEIVALRYFNPIWNHPTGYIGESPNGIPNNLLPYIMQVVTSEREKLSIFWDDYDTLDGTGVRDYIDVCDLVDAHLRVYEHIQKWYEVYNVGTGSWLSVKQILQIAEKVSW